MSSDSSTISPPSAVTPPRRSRWATLLGGCAVGCLGLIIVLVVLVVGLVRWGTRATPVPAIDALLTPDAHLYGSVSIDLADPGTMALVDALTVAAKDGRGELPVRKTAPVRLTVLALGDPPRFVGSVSLSRYMNWLRLSFLPAYYFGSANATSYRRFRILEGGKNPGVVTIVGGSLVAATDADVAKHAVDRFVDGDGGRAAADLDALWGESAGAPVRFVAVNRDGSLVKVFDWIVARTDHKLDAQSPLPDLLRRSRGLTLDAQLGEPAANQIAGHLVLFVPNATADDLETLRSLQPWLQEALKSDKAKLSTEVRGEGERLFLDFRFDLDLPRVNEQKWRWKVGPVEVEGS